jgi:hypothetical protein
MRARGAVDAVAVHVQAAAVNSACFQLRGRHYFAAIVASLVIPRERLAQPFVHPDV